MKFWRWVFEVVPLGVVITGGLAGQPSSTLAVESTWQPGIPEREQRTQQDRDLAVLRDLGDRVQRGEISEQERLLLWQAYLARQAVRAPTDREMRPGKAKFPIFTGPGL